MLTQNIGRVDSSWDMNKVENAGSDGFSHTMVWDGTPETLPSFVLSLKLKAQECGWSRSTGGVPNDSNIVAITLAPGPPVRSNLFEDYQSLTEAQLETACVARTDDR